MDTRNDVFLCPVVSTNQATGGVRTTSDSVNTFLVGLLACSKRCDDPGTPGARSTQRLLWRPRHPSGDCAAPGDDYIANQDLVEREG